eukprot:scaffold95345_cov48-Phaeocystis_antarctica.AAC.2
MMTPSATSLVPTGPGSVPSGSGYAGMHRRQLGAASPAAPSPPLPRPAPPLTPPRLPASSPLGARPGWEGSTLSSSHAAAEGADSRRRCCASPGAYSLSGRSSLEAEA